MVNEMRIFEVIGDFSRKGKRSKGLQGVENVLKRWAF
jgi:hypothetical protein